MKHEDLIGNLLDGPGRIFNAERTVIELAAAVTGAREALADAEARWLLAKREDGSPVLDGRNEAIRNAQLREETIHERGMLLLAQDQHAMAVAELHLEQACFSQQKALARLLEGARD